MKFNASIIDKDFLKARAFAEAKEILKSESKTRGRTDLEVKMDCLYGHAAECYLLQYENFKDDSREYKDVFDRTGKAVDVKVTAHAGNIPYILERANKYASERWRNFPRKLYIFIGNKVTLDYYLYGIYCYNGIEFTKDNHETRIHTQISKHSS
jgi:hypothetical protein